MHAKWSTQAIHLLTEDDRSASSHGFLLDIAFPSLNLANQGVLSWPHMVGLLCTAMERLWSFEDMRQNAALIATNAHGAWYRTSWFQYFLKQQGPWHISYDGSSEKTISKAYMAVTHSVHILQKLYFFAGVYGLSQSYFPLAAAMSSTMSWAASFCLSMMAEISDLKTFLGNFIPLTWSHVIILFFIQLSTDKGSRYHDCEMWHCPGMTELLSSTFGRSVLANLSSTWYEIIHHGTCSCLLFICFVL